MSDEVRHVGRADRTAVQQSLREILRRLRTMIRGKKARAIICFVWEDDGGDGMLRELVSCTEEDFRVMVDRLPDVLARLSGHIGLAKERASGRIKGEA